MFEVGDEVIWQQPAIRKHGYTIPTHAVVVAVNDHRVRIRVGGVQPFEKSVRFEAVEKFE